MKKRSKKNLRRVIATMLVTFLITASISGCGSSVEKKKVDEKIQIKVQYMCGRMNLDLESVLEEKFSNIDIVTDELVGGPGYIIKKEMEHNIEPDIYLYEGLYQMDDKLIADKFYDLSQEEFVNNFYLSAVSECVNEDGDFIIFRDPYMFTA